MLSSRISSTLRTIQPSFRKFTSVSSENKDKKFTTFTISADHPGNHAELLRNEIAKTFNNKISAVTPNNRPNSPWYIYHWGITNTLSLTHRGTGIYMAGLLYSTSLIYLLTGPSAVTLIAGYKALPWLIKFGVKASLLYPLFFHSFNGIRHLVYFFIFIIN